MDTIMIPVEDVDNDIEKGTVVMYDPVFAWSKDGIPLLYSNKELSGDEWARFRQWAKDFVSTKPAAR